MGSFKDLTGQTFGRLTVIQRATDRISASGFHRTLWKCICTCGNIVDVGSSALVRGHTKSCGCLVKEKSRFVNYKHGGNHGKIKSRLYRIWTAMKSRCANPNQREYSRYGGRGITVCTEWCNDFGKFEKWAESSGYNDNLSIDRIDVDGNYCPENCRWITMAEQQKNRSNNHCVTINGVTKILADWCREYNINPIAVAQRISRGWDDIKAITTPLCKNSKHDTYGDDLMNVSA